MSPQQASAAADAQPKPPRSVAEIEADLAATRADLIETVQQLQVTVERTFDPKRILTVQVERVRSIYIDEYGGIRPERVVITVGVVAGFVVVRSIFKKSK